MRFVSNLDTPLLKLSPSDHFTLRDACDGVHVFGGIGSGKTSGTGKTLASAYLRAGMGGIVMCAKPEEVHNWVALAKTNGRAQSVIVFDENHGFNFIDYELARQGPRGISNVTECLIRVLEAADHATGASSQGNDAFWAQATRQVLNYTLPVLYSAYGSVTVPAIIEFVMTAATRPDQQYHSNNEWARSSYAAQSLRKMAENPAVPLTDMHALDTLASYWARQFPVIPDKTRGNVLISLSTRLDRLCHGRLRQAFCTRTTLVPEMTFHGAIIIMAMPVLSWNEDGVIGQQLFKFIWQRAVESRNGLDEKQRDRPVFLYADEAQYFVSVKDDEFLSTCRGSRACVVFLTQTLPTYYAKLGKDKSDAADGLVGKFNTQVFHQNACNRTNSFASQLIGRALQVRNTTGASTGTNTNRGMNAGSNTSYGSNSSAGSSSGNGGSSVSSSHGSSNSSGQNWGDNVGRGRNESQSWGTNETMDNIIEANFFASGLRSGGPKHDKKVTAVWFKAGGNFRDMRGGNFLIPTFQQ